MQRDGTKPEAAHAKVFISFWSADCAVAILVFILGVAIATESYKIGFSAKGGEIQPGYFPFRVGLLISVVSLCYVAKLFRDRARKSGAFTDTAGLYRVLKVLVPSIVYAFLIKHIGIYTSSAIFIAFFMIIIGKQHWLKSSVIAVGAAIALFFLFEDIFQIPLPKGYLVNLLVY